MRRTNKTQINCSEPEIIRRLCLRVELVESCRSCIGRATASVLHLIDDERRVVTGAVLKGWMVDVGVVLGFVGVGGILRAFIVEDGVILGVDVRV